MPAFLMESDFWIALLQIIWIDILLSGDNAIVIALACRSLPEHQRRLGIVLGAGAAVGLRVIFAGFVTYLLEVPYLKAIGALLLLWIAVKLVIPEKEGEGEGEHVAGGSTLFSAIRTIVVADVVMSLDNVIAIAAAAHGSILLLVLGLLISIPLILAGSSFLLKAIERFPILVWGGAALLGWIAGGLLVHDPALAPWVAAEAPLLVKAAPVVGALLVTALGFVVARRIARRRRADVTIELAGSNSGGPAPEGAAPPARPRGEAKERFADAEEASR